MKKYCVVAGFLIAVMGALPLAHSAPPIGFNGAQVTQFLTFNNFASGQVGCQGADCVYFGAQSYDELDGTVTGAIYVSFYINYQFQYIYCSGPAYANSVSVSPGNGNATIRATLDPLSSDCTFVYQVTGPISLNLNGYANGLSRYSSETSFTNEFSGQVLKGRSQSDQFSDTFKGTISSASGSFSGFFGSASSYRNTQINRVK
jgi:hypothetical protein